MQFIEFVLAIARQMAAPLEYLARLLQQLPPPVLDLVRVHLCSDCGYLCISRMEKGGSA